MLMWIPGSWVGWSTGLLHSAVHWHLQSGDDWFGESDILNISILYFRIWGTYHLGDNIKKEYVCLCTFMHIQCGFWLGLKDVNTSKCKRSQTGDNM